MGGGRLINRGWCTVSKFSLSGYKFLVNMEPIQGNHDRREPILRKMTPNSFFPKLRLSPFRSLSPFKGPNDLCLYNGWKFFKSPAPVRCWTRGGKLRICYVALSPVRKCPTSSPVFYTGVPSAPPKSKFFAMVRTNGHMASKLLQLDIWLALARLV